jgi:hypothetical protein
MAGGSSIWPIACIAESILYNRFAAQEDFDVGRRRGRDRLIWSGGDHALYEFTCQLRN